MIFERIKSEGLAHNSYYLGSGNDAGVIDPRRDVQVYVDAARRHGQRINCILETHRNEDYVIGSQELAHETGAPIYHGPGIDWKYGDTLQSGQEFKIGKLVVSTVFTPGHTDESVSYLLTDTASGKAPVMVFGGDALFVNGSGRTDLGEADDAPRRAANLYESIFSKMLPLGDGVILCPAHGAGSVCGASIADRDESTLGIERKQNPVLQSATKDEFVRRKLAEHLERPPYFDQMERYNQEGHPLLSLRLPPGLSPTEFKREMENGAVVVDTSQPVAYAGAHIKGSLSIRLGELPSLAGWVLSYDKPLLLVLEDEAGLDQAIRYLARIGYDNVPGFLRGGIESWYNASLPVESLPLLTVHELKSKLDRKDDLTLLDVRRQDEWESGHVKEAQHIYVGRLENQLNEVPRDKPVAVMCSVGNRSGLAASILLREGYDRVQSVPGSIVAWRKANYPLIK